jgi:DNA-binding CsgD family transcriptional regulator
MPRPKPALGFLPLELAVRSGLRSQSNRDVARALGVDERVVYRYRRTGLQTTTADRFCARVGITPYEVWPDWEQVVAAAAAAQRVPRPALDPVEARVLAAVASGDGYRDIARSMSYSEAYVRTLLTRVNLALGSNNRAHAAAMGVALRVIRRDGYEFVPA